MRNVWDTDFYSTKYVQCAAVVRLHWRCGSSHLPARIGRNFGVLRRQFLVCLPLFFEKIMVPFFGPEIGPKFWAENWTRFGRLYIIYNKLTKPGPFFGQDFRPNFWAQKWDHFFFQKNQFRSHQKLMPRHSAAMRSALVRAWRGDAKTTRRHVAYVGAVGVRPELHVQTRRADTGVYTLARAPA